MKTDAGAGTVSGITILRKVVSGEMASMEPESNKSFGIPVAQS